MEAAVGPRGQYSAPLVPPGGRSAPGEGHSRPGAALAGLRVLIVEDEAFVALEAQELLEEAGCEVVALAATADQAVERADALAPDLVLMDIRLLGPRDGIEAAIEMRERFGIRCLFVSAHTDPETRARAERAEPAGFLAKPFTRTALLEAATRAAGVR